MKPRLFLFLGACLLSKWFDKKVCAKKKSMKQPKVSLIIPCHNPGKYLKICIESVKRQTLENIEVLIIDDKSDDGSVDQIGPLLDERFIVIKNDEQIGAAISRNKAIDIAKGKYIAFMDGDDFYPNSTVLECLYETAESERAEICGGSLFTCDDSGNIISDKIDGQYFAKAGLMQYVDYQHDGGFYRFIYKRDLLNEKKIRFPDYLRMQDPVFFVNAMSSSSRVYVIPRYTYAYRKNHKTVSWTTRKVKDHFQAVRDLLLLSKERSFNRLHLLMVRNFVRSIITKPWTLVDHGFVILQIISAISLRSLYSGWNEIRRRKSSGL